MIAGPLKPHSRGAHYLITIDSPLVNTATGEHLSIRLQVNDMLVGLNPTLEGKVDFILQKVRDYVEGLLVAEARVQ